ncbi:hypothetical protein GCM10009696_14530 [Kocuria himachalensis]
MPPDSSTPTGTSATMRRLTAVRSFSTSPSCQSCSDQSERSSSRVNWGFQYSWSEAEPSRSTVRTVAGGSFRTPWRIVRGAGTTEWKVR